MFKKSIWSRKFLLVFFAILSVFISTNLASGVIPDLSDMSYFSGDAHIHTSYSKDLLFTSPIADQYNAAKTLGLDWIAITDHSDVVFFNRFVRDYMTDAKWQEQQAEIAKIDFPVLLGEEITIGNGQNLETEGHFLAYGLSGFVTTLSSYAPAPLGARRDGEAVLQDVE